MRKLLIGLAVAAVALGVVLSPAGKTWTGAPTTSAGKTWTVPVTR